MLFSTKEVIDVIKENFPNGVRDDYIDTNKIFRICSAQYPNENISRDLIAEVVRANGIEHGGKFYFISNGNIKAVLRFVNENLRRYPLLYYSTLYEKNAVFFAQMNIFSAEVLKKILRENDLIYFYFEDFCAANRTARLDYEVAKIFSAAENPLSVEDVQSKLFYVPQDKILAVLNTDKYLQTIDGNYIPLSKLQFDKDEINAAMNQLRKTISAQGYATADSYDLSTNFALNSDVSEKVLRNLIHKKFFAGVFVKRGNKLYNKGDTNINLRHKTFTGYLREILSQRQEVSLNELVNYLNMYGMTNKAITVALDVANEKMIRVEKNLFVKDALIDFDVDAVDEALSVFVQSKIIPLRAVVSFTGFPNLRGYSWNLFLLESFLRKYSRRYTFITPASNNSNTGAIFPKSMKFYKYLDVQATALLQENIPLNKVDVEEFLNKSGYRANFKSDKVTDPIIVRAKELRGNF